MESAPNPASGPISAEILSNLPLRIFQSARPLILCVSGGRDSMLLLELFRELHDGGLLRAEPVVFHYAHRLREASAADGEFVREAARRCDLPFYIKEGNVRRMASRTGQGLEAAGRILRYRAARRLAERIGAEAAVTGHHADDYAESLLLHLTRGGGPQALATMPLVTRLDGLQLFRPLLVLSRTRIDALVREADLAFREDETNADEGHRRNRLRAAVLPELRTMGLDSVKLWRNFHELPEDAEWAGAEEVKPAPVPREIRLDRSLLHDPSPAEWKRAFDLGLRRLGLPPMERPVLNELLRQRRRGGADFLLRFESRRLLIWSDRRGPVWLFHREGSLALRPFRRLDESGDRVRLIYNGREATLRLAPGQFVDVFRPGDQVRLATGGTKKVKKIFQELGVPSAVRRHLPLVREGRSGPVSRLCLSFWGERDLCFPAGATDG